MKKLIFLIIVFCSIQKINAQCTFVADTSNPIIGYNQFINNVFWNDPSVMKEGTTYHMWLSGGDLTLPSNALNATLPYYSSSSDGINWNINTTPLFTGNGAGTYDGHKVETPSVIKETGTYHMYYTSRSDPNDIFSISHATSSNVSTGWIQDANNPLISPTGTITDWNGAQVGEPAITVKNGIFYLFFVAVGCKDLACSTYPSSSLIKAAMSIGLVTSADGVNFSAPTQVLTKGVMYPDNLNFEGYSTPYVYLENSVFHLYYDVYQYISSEDEHRQVALHHAVSSDGYSWTEDSAPIFKRTDFAWTAMEVRAPSVINDNGIWKMWFAGNAELPIDSTLAGIGYAECNSTTNIIDELNNQPSISAYPNPFNYSVTICLDKAVNNAELNIYNVYGQKTKTIKNISADKIKINRDNLPNGVYFIRLTQDNKIIATDKLIITD